MYISTKDWLSFVDKLSKINKKASDSIVAYVQKNGFEDTNALIRHCYGVAEYYGNASASFAAMMYDTIGELEGKFYDPAELAPNPSYGDVAKAVQGTMKTSMNPEEIAGSVARLVKQVGQDTLLYNGIRDQAEFAWIPNGDTCAFCIALASRGWQPISAKALRNGHAEHIHSNCDCTYMIRHRRDFDVAGYDPDKYYQMYESGADVPYENDNMSHPDRFQTTSMKNINGMRRKFYQENKEKILKEKADRAEERKQLESSSADEVYVN